MTRIEKRIERILEDLKNNSCVDVEKFLEDFNVSESTLRRDFNRVIKYIAYQDVVKNAYGIDSAIELELYLYNTQRISSIYIH